MSYDRLLQANIGDKTKSLALLAGLLLLPLVLAPAYADDQTVSIDHGKEVCEECFTPNVVAISPGDTVTWVNNDSSVHSVTSGNPVDGLDGMYDSQLIQPGNSFSYTFTAEGQYSYHCMLHPWAVGYVAVGIAEEEVVEIVEPEPVVDETLDPERSLKTVHHVGLDVDPESTHTIDYVSTGEIITTKVNHNGKTLSLNFKEPVANEYVVLRIPTDVLSGPVFVRTPTGEVPAEFETGDGFNIITVQLDEEPVSRITIQGTQVIPEFGAVAFAVLAITIASVIAVTRKQGVFLR